MADIHQEIQDAIAEVWASANRAEELIAGNCPGPHAYVQHRDRRPPWCRACGYTAGGLNVRATEADRAD